MAGLSKLFCEQHETKDCLLELVKSWKCPKCKGAQHSCLITIAAADLPLREFESVSIVLACDSCGRSVNVLPEVRAGTSLRLFVGHTTDFSVLLCKPSVKAIRLGKQRTSIEHKSSETRNGKREVTSSSKTRKADGVLCFVDYRKG